MAYLSRQELEEQLQSKTNENNRLSLKNNELVLSLESLRTQYEAIILELEELRIKSNNSDQVRDYIYEHNYEDVITLIESLTS